MAALDGIMVADFSRVLAGPYATMLLADLGADVVKIERPGSGDDTRSWGPPFADDGQSTYFHSINRNKRSIALDLKRDRQQAHELAITADVIVENFTTGTMSTFGLDYASIAAINPGVVYCSISGFGADVNLPGYDLLVQAMGGLMSVTGPSPNESSKVGVAVVDVLTGLHAAVGILAALRHRESTGIGQHVEVSLMSALLASLVNQSSGYVLAGVVPHAMGNAHPSITPYEVYRASDRPIVIAVGNDGQFAKFCVAIGRAELVSDTRFATNTARVAHRAALNEILDVVIVTRTADEWQQALTDVGVPCGPINDIAQAFDLATRLGLEPVARIQDGTPTVASPIRLSETPVEYRLSPPTLGRST